MGIPNYGPQTIATPFQAAIDRYASPQPSLFQQNQGAFHPSMMVASPTQSHMFGGPTNAPGIAAADAANPTVDPQVAALHAAIAKYYGG